MRRAIVAGYPDFVSIGVILHRGVVIAGAYPLAPSRDVAVAFAIHGDGERLGRPYWTGVPSYPLLYLGERSAGQHAEQQKPSTLPQAASTRHQSSRVRATVAVVMSSYPKLVACGGTPSLSVGDNTNNQGALRCHRARGPRRPTPRRHNCVVSLKHPRKVIAGAL